VRVFHGLQQRHQFLFRAFRYHGDTAVKLIGNPAGYIQILRQANHSESKADALNAACKSWPKTALWSLKYAVWE